MLLLFRESEIQAQIINSESIIDNLCKIKDEKIHEIKMYCENVITLFLQFKYGNDTVLTTEINKWRVDFINNISSDQFNNCIFPIINCDKFFKDYF